MIKKRAQAFGLDVIVASSLFILAAATFFFYSLNHSNESGKTYDLMSYQGENLADTLLSEGYPENWNEINALQTGILTGEKVNESKLQEFYDMAYYDYTKTKYLFKITDEYYINFSQPLTVRGTNVPFIGRYEANPDNLIKITRIINYENRPTKVFVYIWNKEGVEVSDIEREIISDTDLIIVSEFSSYIDGHNMNGETSGVVSRGCDDPQMNLSSTEKLSVVSCLTKEIAGRVLSGENNRVSIVTMTENISGSGLTADLSLINNTVDNVSPGGILCLSCGINKAYEILESQSSPERKKAVIILTQGSTQLKSQTECYDTLGIDNYNSSYIMQVGALRYPGSSVVFDRTMRYSNFRNKGFGAKYNPTKKDFELVPTENYIYTIEDMSLVNSTFGYGTGDSYEGSLTYRYYRWNGTALIEEDLYMAGGAAGTYYLYAVDMLNSTFGISAGNSRIPYYLGNSWNNLGVSGQTIKDMKLVNGTFGVTVGLSGVSMIWNGVEWNQYNPYPWNASSRYIEQGTNFFAVDMADGQFGFAGGQSTNPGYNYRGRISFWNGTEWKLSYSINLDENFLDISIYNRTFALASTSRNRIYKWDGTNWSKVYEGDQNSEIALYTVKIINATFAIAAGSNNAGFIIWDGSSWTTMFPSYFLDNEMNSSSGMSCGPGFNQEFISAANSNYSVYRLNKDLSAKVSVIGIGENIEFEEARRELIRNSIAAMADSGQGSSFISRYMNSLRAFVMFLTSPSGASAPESEPPAPGGGGSPPSLTEGLLAYYDFNGSYDDSSGNMNNGIGVNSTYLSFGQIGTNRFLSDGSSNSFVRVPANPTLNLGSQFSFSTWVYPVWFPDTEWADIAIERLNSDGVGLIMKLSPGGASFGGAVYNSGNTYFSESSLRPYNNWYHVVFTYNSTSGGVLYVNGNSAYSLSTSGDNVLLNRDLIIGGYSPFTGSSPFMGRIDKLIIYDRSLSSSEVTSLYTEQAGSFV